MTPQNGNTITFTIDPSAAVSSTDVSPLDFPSDDPNEQYANNINVDTPNNNQFQLQALITSFMNVLPQDYALLKYVNTWDDRHRQEAAAVLFGLLTFLALVKQASQNQSTGGTTSEAPPAEEGNAVHISRFLVTETPTKKNPTGYDYNFYASYSDNGTNTTQHEYIEMSGINSSDTAGKIVAEKIENFVKGKIFKAMDPKEESFVAVVTDFNSKHCKAKNGIGVIGVGRLKLNSQGNPGTGASD
ncbi:MAG TPA: hypothetical protein VKK79_22025 [Candidatus Lokiarchaeia archaeon]|nr:hypothetical protein [Candidatus Lokiarchaeia archaeon]